MQVTQILLVVVLEISQQMHQSNFMGNLAGNQAINAYNSNFFGYNSGNASGANSSNFFGSMLVNTHRANTSNFIGVPLELMQQMRSIQISLVGTQVQCNKCE
jgi:hypothetical protein